MKKFLSMLFGAVLLLSMSSCRERIDAGYEGILVNLYGDNKGVDDVVLVTGTVWYNPLFKRVYEYPMYVQAVDYAPFEINAKDALLMKQ